jgi:hypothetical protein
VAFSGMTAGRTADTWPPKSPSSTSAYCASTAARPSTVSPGRRVGVAPGSPPKATVGNLRCPRSGERIHASTLHARFLRSAVRDDRRPDGVDDVELAGRGRELPQLDQAASSVAGGGVGGAGGFKTAGLGGGGGSGGGQGSVLSSGNSANTNTLAASIQVNSGFDVELRLSNEIESDIRSENKNANAATRTQRTSTWCGGHRRHGRASVGERSRRDRRPRRRRRRRHHTDAVPSRRHL